MRASLSTFLTAVALAAFATPASAATVASFTDGGAPLLPGETVFATFDAGSDGGVTGVNFNILTGSSGLGADPATGGQGDPYLSVFGGGTASFSFGPVAFLGLDYGSADTYNTFALLLLDGTTELFTGQDIINVGTADGNQAEPRTNGRLTFTNALNPIVGLTLSSTQNSLEVDRLSSVAAVPEPGTWALMLLGFGAIGVAMRRRRSPRLLQLA